MIPVLTPAEMGAADARTIAAGTPASVLMQRAGRAVAWRARAVLGGTYGRRAAIVCGTGNNGGDGRIAAAALAAWGVRTEVVEIDRAGLVDPAAARRAIGRADLVVDAVLGTGFQGAWEGAGTELVTMLTAAGAVVLAVDIPSGVDGRTGEIRGAAVRADHTVTFAAPKTGLWFLPGRAHVGTLTVADIGIDLGPDAHRTVVTEATDVARWIPARDAATHKWRSGVLVIGGSRGMTGAPMLAGHAATHAGAGIVIVALPDSVTSGVGPSELIVRGLPDRGTGGLGPDSVAAAVAGAERFGAAVLGPGVGRDPAVAAVVGDLLRSVPVPVVLDADGLVALAGDLAAVKDRGASTVLTPHDGEFASLSGSAPGPDRVAAARDLAAASGAVVLLKGPTTVVAAPDGRAALNPTGSADLATAGSGDVLGGIIAAFCARGTNAFEAAAAAAFVHGQAAEQGGHTGFVATDLPALAGASVRQLVGS